MPRTRGHRPRRQKHVPQQEARHTRRQCNLENNSDGTVTPEHIAYLYTREHCTYCGFYVNRPDRTIDHVFPLSKGGMHSIWNLVMVCRKCNQEKGDMMPSQYAETVWVRH